MAVKRAKCASLLGGISGLWQVLSLMGSALCLDDQSEEQLFVRVGRAGRWARAGFKWMSAVAVIAWIVGSWVAVKTGGCLCDIVFSVETLLSICMVNQYGVPGGIMSDTPMLLEGKAVRVFSIGVFSAGGVLANIFMATSRACRTTCADMCKRAVAAGQSMAPAFFEGYARASGTAYSGGLSGVRGVQTERCYGFSSDWRIRLSGAAGGIPPAPT